MPAVTSSSDQNWVITPIAEMSALGEALMSAIESHKSVPQWDHDTTDMFSRSGVAPDDKERT